MHQETNYCASDLLNTSRVIDKVGIYSKYTEVLPIEDIINGMLDWVRVIDRNNNIIYANKAMLDDIKHQVVGKKCYEVFCKKEPCDNCISRMVALDGKTHEKEEMFDERYFSVKSSPIRDRDGEIIAVVEVLRDITNEKMLKQKIVLQNKQHMDDINIAKKIQMSFLPTNLKQDKVSFSFIYSPCKELGGDFLDIFMIDEEHMGLYIADVAGHGITASLLTVFLRSSFNKSILSPSVALTELYNEFNAVGFDDNLYITVFYAILDFKNNAITYANAGHSTCPIVFNDTR
ncbi:MAG: SpoIIE family protein phosphatase, partial [Clostridiaceae bacterium]|nr:SpoIIE family protein phosphatase [Clostridiaceae bacterium]